MESNFDVLGLVDSANKKEIHEAFRKLALKHHSDRGGDEEKFKKIKQAYDDLKIGKKYPDDDKAKQKKSKVYSGDDKEQIQKRNKIIATELSKEMQLAQEWAAALNRSNTVGTRLFGSKTVGEIELERKANNTLLIKGNFLAGTITYNGSILMQGNITSPSFNDDYITNITTTKGDFKLVNPLENKYKIENGSHITAQNGDIVVGNVFGRKDQVQDPDGRVGLYLTKEHRTMLFAPNGSIVIENAINTVTLNADTIIALNLEDDVTLSAREILIHGSKITYNVQIHLKKSSSIRFFTRSSILSLSDDAIITLDDKRTIRLHELKTKKIKDLPDDLVVNKEQYDKNATMVGNGFIITYAMLDHLEKGFNASWKTKFGILSKK